MGKAWCPRQQRLSRLHRHGDDKVGNGQSGMACGLAKIHADGPLRRTARGRDRPGLSCIRCEQLFHRKQSRRRRRSAHEELHDLTVTRVEDLARTVEIHKSIFHTRGLQKTWSRVIAVVVQPGVEFEHSRVIDFEPAKAASLSKAILRYEGMVYEAHSTDYQTEAALTDLVRKHFAILKVGPGLTYAAREAIFALSRIEQEWITDRPYSNIQQKLKEVMLTKPGYWDQYYIGDESERALARKYSFSDRLRYYWPDPEVDASLRVLVTNLSSNPPPLTLLSQFLPSAFKAIRKGKIANEPLSIIRHRIGEVLSEYARACGLSPKLDC
jgi:D-tagatose-1,6-bisphosphate aldolase subunit GatZ/KbaZ